MERSSLLPLQIDGGSITTFETKNISGRRIRQRRPMYLAQLASYLIDIVILSLYCVHGTLTTSASIGYFLSGVAVTALALALSEIGINDRYTDHYLTVPQSIGNISVQLGAIYFLPEVGIYFVTIIFIILGFGALRMTALQTAIVWTYATAGLIALLLMTDKAIGLPMETLAERALAAACFVTALGRSASTGLYGSAMREALYKRGNELKGAYARIETLAQTDELTGALNRRAILQLLDQEISQTQRTGQLCAVAMIDVDFFKKINDAFGHPIGDDVLRSFSITLFANIRNGDRLGRYGGEEFLLVLPHTAGDEALRILDRLRLIVAESDWSAVSPDLQVTISAGVATLRATDDSDTILTRADRALYSAKNAGRNQVILT
ncbi:MAG: hypothetical protein JWQ82_633 [Tardiphaga sp.]|nr:hypothetical protein [Tardiphaga sp.]